MSATSESDLQTRPSNPLAKINLEHELTSGFAHRFIRFKAKQILGRAGIRHSDREDLEQDLRYRILQSFRLFDPTVSDWESFVTTVVERRVASLVRRGKAHQRHGLVDQVSLSEAAVDEEGQQVELADRMSADNQGKVNGRYSRSGADSIAMVHDLDRAMETLPDDQRRTCEELKRITVKSLARKRRVPRATLIYELLPIREHFDRAGISEF